MTTVAYRVAPIGEKWQVTRDGELCFAREPAYEVAVAEACGDLRTGMRSRLKWSGALVSALATDRRIWSTDRRVFRTPCRALHAFDFDMGGRQPSHHPRHIGGRGDRI